jgi:hypothetical protein
MEKDIKNIIFLKIIFTGRPWPLLQTRGRCRPSCRLLNSILHNSTIRYIRYFTSISRLRWYSAKYVLCTRYRNYIESETRYVVSN